MSVELHTLLPSIVYGGKEYPLSAWPAVTLSETETADGRRTVRESTAPDGLLKVRVTMQEYRDFPAVKIWPELVGCGERDSAIVSAFRSFDFECPQISPETTLRAVTGSKNKPVDFSAREFRLSEIAGQNSLELVCDEGRSSCSWMPYFGLDLDTNEGLEFAIGWSGAWRLECGVRGGGNEEPGRVFCRFGMRDLAAYVKPGEVLRQPSVLVLRRSGMSAAAFQTVIHDFMIAHNCPRDSRGELLEPILPVTASGGNRRPEDMRKVIDWVVREKLPFDVFWVDAGWYGPPHIPDMTTNCGDCWWLYAGDWRVNTGVHASGSLKGVADAVHAAGMRFLLWIEPERVVSGAPVLREHPDYALGDPKARRADGKYESMWVDPNYINLLDLGNDGARQWIFDTICRTIDENGVDVYRQDFNLDPAPIWAAADGPGRRGVREIRHVTGLYRLWDDLRARYPDMLFDNCASGGRRLDFELMSRAHAYCRSDFFIPRDREPRLHRSQIVMGENAMLNMLAWVPFQGSEANCCTLFDDGEFFGALGTGIVFTPADWGGGGIDRPFTPEETAWFRKVFSAADRVRKILVGKFYPLTPRRSLAEDVWAAYEGFLPERGEGFAAFFRRTDAPETMTFALENVDAGAEYELEDASTGEVVRVSGRELRSFTVTLPKAPDGKIVFFRKQ